MSQVHSISTSAITTKDVQEIINNRKSLDLSEEIKSRIQKCRTFLEEKIAASDRPYYGINTGFGSLCNVKIDNSEISQLQHNLVMSHACGMGDEAPQEIVRLIVLLKIQSLSYGFSGVRLKLVERLILLYNNEAFPVIYEQGSLGASGDLAPLAHLSLALIGKGEMYLHGIKMPAELVHENLGLSPLTLQAKEGLALLNGTQFSLAYGLWSSIQANKIAKLSDLITTVSLDAFDCRLEPFDERIHKNRPHKFQIATATQIRTLLQGSEIVEQEKTDVQDPYAFRCVPQVHGASKSTIDYVKGIVETELNSVTDNPNIFPDTDAILSGGNFHAQPLALGSDFLAIALSELGSISERRLYQLIGGKRGLPPFLTQGAGLHSGLMISQYTAASIASQNKQLCTPASVDSIVSCNGQEDHVSMAANAGTKLYKVVKNVYSLLAIELMAAAQGLEFRRPMISSKYVEKFVAAYRNEIPKLEQDRILYKDMHQSVSFLENLNLEEFLPE